MGDCFSQFTANVVPGMCCASATGRNLRGHRTVSTTLIKPPSAHGHRPGCMLH